MPQPIISRLGFPANMLYIKVGERPGLGQGSQEFRCQAMSLEPLGFTYQDSRTHRIWCHLGNRATSVSGMELPAAKLTRKPLWGQHQLTGTAFGESPAQF